MQQGRQQELVLFVSSATKGFHSKQKWACNSISRHTNEGSLCSRQIIAGGDKQIGKNATTNIRLKKCN